MLSALKIGTSALNAAAIGIQTAGNNIANAGDDKFSRQRVELASTASNGDAPVLIGTGVEVARIQRMVDETIENSLRNSQSRSEFLAAQDLILGRLEQVLNELDGTGIDAAISAFFDAAQSLVNDPEDLTARTILISAGETLASTFRERDQELLGIQEDLNSRVENAVLEINRLTMGIAELNSQVVVAESGSENVGTANDLRDKRYGLIDELSNLVDIKVVGTSNGSINITTGSDFLVENVEYSELSLDLSLNDDIELKNPKFINGGKLVRPDGGELGGLLQSRDDTVQDLRDDLSTLAASFIFEVNKLHSSGAGLSGLTDVTASESVDSVIGSLNNVGLPFTPKTGSFDFKVINEVSEQIKTFNIRVDLDGLNNNDTSLQDLVSTINTTLQTDFPGISASIDSTQHLRIQSTDSNLSFFFANDNSDVLASLGVSGFFTGSRAGDMDVSESLVNDPNLLAAGLGDGPEDGRNMAEIALLREKNVLQGEQATFQEFYTGIVGVIGVEKAQVANLLENQESIRLHFQNERASFSGVNIDEESVDLIKFQKMYQGAARYIGVVDSLLEELLNIV